MRMKVVLPLPLGPRKPQISPRCTWRSMWSTAVRSPNRLVMPRTSMARSFGITVEPQEHVDGLAGVELRGHGGVEGDLDHEDELAAALAAVDDRRGELRAGRDEAARVPASGSARPSTTTRTVSPSRDRADARFGHEGPHLDVRRREQHDDGLARGDPLALAEERVLNEPGLGRGLALLGEVPFGLGQRSFEGIQVGLGGADLVLASAEAGGLQICFELGDAIHVLVARSAGADDVFLATRIPC